MFDFTSIRDILKRERSKIIIVEDGRPSYVLLPIDDYRTLVSRTDSGVHRLEQEILTKDDEILIDNKKENEGMAYVSDNATLEEFQKSRNLKLEDLPF